MHPAVEVRRMHPAVEVRRMHPAVEVRRMHPAVEVRRMHPAVEVHHKRQKQPVSSHIERWSKFGDNETEEEKRPGESCGLAEAGCAGEAKIVLAAARALQGYRMQAVVRCKMRAPDSEDTRIEIETHRQWVEPVHIATAGRSLQCTQIAACPLPEALGVRNAMQV